MADWVRGWKLYSAQGHHGRFGQRRAVASDPKTAADASRTKRPKNSIAQLDKRKALTDGRDGCRGAAYQGIWGWLSVGMRREETCDGEASESTGKRERERLVKGAVEGAVVR